MTRAANRERTGGESVAGREDRKRASLLAPHDFSVLYRRDRTKRKLMHLLKEVECPPISDPVL